MTGRSGVKRRGFLLPVADHGGGADQQDRPLFASLPVPLNQGQGLDRLAQSHIVGQAGAQAPLAQESEPGVTPPLVRPQGPLEFGGIRQFLKGGASSSWAKKSAIQPVAVTPSNVKLPGCLDSPQSHL